MLDRMALDRRTVLIGAGVAGAAAGALVIGLALVPRHFRAPLVAGEGEHVIDALIRLARDGTVTVAVPALEMGQGVSTLAAQIVAVELGADWRRVGVEPAPLSPVYADPVIAAAWAQAWLPRAVAAAPLIGDTLAQALAGAPGDALVRYQADRVPVLITACGTTLATFEPRLRQAAATLRHVLIAAAARIAGQPETACDTQDHHVVCGKHRWSFAALIDSALIDSALANGAHGEAGVITSAPDSAPLRPAPARETADPVPGAHAAPAFPRLDLPAMVDGSLVFAADLRLPGMVHAAIAHGPEGLCRLASHDAAAAAHVPGMIAVVTADRWLAAVAQTWHAADRALAAMDPRFRVEPHGGRVADSVAIEAAIEAAAAHAPAQRLFAEGDPDALFAHGGPGQQVLAAQYHADAALHAPLEPASATARLLHDRLELWIASQAPEAAAQAAARGAGLPRHAVTVYPMPAGGSFDARLDVRIAEEVAVIARQVGRPVQLTWSRWQETLAGFPRAPVAAKLHAAFDPPRAHLIGWRARLTTPASAIEAGARLFGGLSAAAAQDAAAGAADPLAVAGAMPVYAIPERAVDHAPVSISLPAGRLRGGADAATAFFTESFLDECAHFAGAEPLSFRVAMLGSEPRLVACLEGAGQLAMWGGGGNGAGQGLACHRLVLAAPEGPRFGYIAVIATVRANGQANQHVGGGAIHVESLAAFCDIGRVINRDIARQQIEGGLLFGLAQALGAPVRWNEGRPHAPRLADLGLPLLADCPKVDVAFAASDAEPFDPGELGVVAVAPAIGNAVFSASGTRVRRLPFLSESLT